MKWCPKCEVEKPRTEFYRRQGRVDGLQGYCKNCSAEEVKRYDRSPVGKAKKQIYVARPKVRVRRRAIEEKRRQGDPFRRALSHAKTRAKSKNLPFDLDEASVREMYFDHCPICSQEMWFGGNPKTSPSIDQIIPALGYTKVNCHMVCNACNTRKSDSTPEQMYQIADYIYKLRRERGLEDAGTGSDDREEV